MPGSAGFPLPELLLGVAFCSCCWVAPPIFDPQPDLDFLCMFVGAQAANVLLSTRCRVASVLSCPDRRAQLDADFLCMFVGAQAANVLVSMSYRSASILSWPELNRAPAFVRVGCSSSDLPLIVDEVRGTADL
jgi:hypothetical protein